MGRSATALLGGERSLRRTQTLPTWSGLMPIILFSYKCNPVSPKQGWILFSTLSAQSIWSAEYAGWCPTIHFFFFCSFFRFLLSYFIFMFILPLRLFIKIYVLILKVLVMFSILFPLSMISGGKSIIYFLKYIWKYI